jgi:hypothetical protein
MNVSAQANDLLISTLSCAAAHPSPLEGEGLGERGPNRDIERSVA